MVDYEKIQPNVWKPEKVGDQIEGVLINVEPSGKYANNSVFHLETSDHKQIAIFGTTVLEDRMKYVKPGEQVKIVFQGVSKNKKGQNTKIFDVYRAKIIDAPAETPAI